MQGAGANSQISFLAADLPQPGERWGFNVVRNEKPQGETNTWAPLFGPGRSRAAGPGRVLFVEGTDRRPTFSTRIRTIAFASSLIPGP